MNMVILRPLPLEMVIFRAFATLPVNLLYILHNM